HELRVDRVLAGETVWNRIDHSIPPCRAADRDTGCTPPCRPRHQSARGNRAARACMMPTATPIVGARRVPASPIWVMPMLICLTPKGLAVLHRLPGADPKGCVRRTPEASQHEPPQQGCELRLAARPGFRKYRLCVRPDGSHLAAMVH